MVLALLFLLLVVVVIGFFLPSKVHLERSIEINRNPATIFKVINSLNNFNKWSPWYEYDVNAEYTLTGAKTGVGSKLSWSGNDKIGTGSNEIIESKLDSYIKTKFFFGKSEKPAFSMISLLPQDETTKVTWAFNNDFGYNVFYRYFGLVLEEMIAPDYEKGLKYLKKHAESLPLYDYSNISITETQAQGAYAYRSQSGLSHDEITPAIAAAYGKLIGFITKNKVAMNGSPKIVNLSTTSDAYQFLAVIPVNDNSISDENNEIQAYNSYQGKAVKLVHKGSYKNFDASYDILYAYMSQNNLQKNGNSWEDFVTDPANVSEDLLITNIYQPIK
jgi:effector-binding domain-containing protein